MMRVRFDRRDFLSAAVSLLAAPAVARPAPDLPGQESPSVEQLPAPLAVWLPPATPAAFDPPPASQGWGAFQVSPGGKWVLAERSSPGRRAVFLLDPAGEPRHDLSSERFPLAQGAWGADDDLVFLEGRHAPQSTPEYVRLSIGAGKSSEWKREGLPVWSGSGRDYIVLLPPGESPTGGVPLPDRFQRFGVGHQAVGGPLPISDPVWSGDGQWLAFTRAPRRSATVQLPDLAVIPARGDTIRVLLTGAGWERTMQERSWDRVLSVEPPVWSPGGEFLLLLVQAASAAGQVTGCLRLDWPTGKRTATELGAGVFRIHSVSARGRSWVVQVDERLLRLDFKPVEGPARR